MTNNNDFHLTTDVETSQTESIPLYHQIIRTLRSEILEGKYQVGSKIPTEDDLCKRFDVSRGTIRRALDELVKENLLYRKQGVGTFVTNSRIHHNLMYLRGLAEELYNQGHEPEIQELNRSIDLAPEEIAEKLGLGKGEPIIYIERLLSSKGDKLAYTKSFFPYKDFSELMKMEPGKNILEVIEQEIGLDVAYALEDIEPALATPEDARLLDIPEDSLLHRIHAVIYSPDGTPIMFFKSVLRPDRYRLSILLYRMRE